MTSREIWLENLEGNPFADLSGYELRHLPVHLNEARRYSDLHQLLRLGRSDEQAQDHQTSGSGNAWFDAKQSLGDESGYLADVRLAWEVAQAATRRLCQSGLAADTVGLEARYALYEASLNSLAQNVPAGMLVALVEQRVWEEPQGIHYVRQTPDEGARAEILAGLAGNLHGVLLQDALEIAIGIGDEALRAKVLIALGPQASDSQLAAMIPAALGIGDEALRTKVLIALGPQASDSQLAAMIDAALSLRNYKNRGLVIASLALQIARRPTDEWMHLVSDMRDTGVRATIICALAPHTSQPGSHVLLKLALQIRYPVARFEALYCLSNHLSEPLAASVRSKAAETAEMIRGPRPRARALTRVGQLRLASQAIASIAHLDDRREARAALAPHLSRGLRPDVVTAALRIKSSSQRANAMSYLVPLLTADLLRDVLRTVVRFRYASSRAKALSALAPHLPEALFDTTLTSVQESGHKSDPILALEALAPHTPAGLARRVLEVIRALPVTDAYSGRPLTALIPRLAECGFHSESLSGVSELRSGAQRAKALAGSAPHLTEPVLGQALELAMTVKGNSARAEALGAIARRLSADMLRSTLAELRWIGDEDARLLLMASLAPFLPQELLEEAFVAARRISSPARRALAVVSVAECLPAKLFIEAEYTVKAVSKEDSREQALANLALIQIDRGDHAAGLRIASDIADESRRASVLIRMAPTLPLRSLLVALADVRDMVSHSARAEALAGLAQQLPGEDQKAVFDEAVDAASSIRSKEGQRAPEGYWAAINQILEYVDIVTLLQEIAVGLPSDDPGLKEDNPWDRADTWAVQQLRAMTVSSVACRMAQSGYVDDAQAAASRIDHDYARAKALAGVLPHLSGSARVDLAHECLRIAVDTAQRGSAICFYPSWISVQTIAKIASNVPAPLIDEAISAVESIKQRWPVDVEQEAVFLDSLHQVGLAASPRMLREALPLIPQVLEGLGRTGHEEGLLQMCLAQAKAGLASQLPEPAKGRLRREAFAEATAISNEHVRAQALVTVARFLTKPFLIKAIDATRAIGHERARAEAIAGLAQYLGPTDRMGEALAIALRIESVSHRPVALTAVAQRLAGAKSSVVSSLWLDPAEGEAVLSLAARRTREGLLADLRALNTITGKLGTAEASAEIFRAVTEVGRWWP